MSYHYYHSHRQNWVCQAPGQKPMSNLSPTIGNCKGFTWGNSQGKAAQPTQTQCPANELQSQNPGTLVMHVFMLTSFPGPGPPLGGFIISVSLQRRLSGTSALITLSGTLENIFLCGILALTLWLPTDLRSNMTGAFGLGAPWKVRQIFSLIHLTIVLGNILGESEPPWVLALSPV